jgi:hypothetical protein
VHGPGNFLSVPAAIAIVMKPDGCGIAILHLDEPICILGIGASAGGLEALEGFLFPHPGGNAQGDPNLYQAPLCGH